MREILFKGLLKTGKGWAFGNLRVDKKGCTIITPDETPLGIYGVVDPETVCQYTGLTDKNGVKIFEGDILSTDIARPYLIVEYRNGAFMANCNDGGNDYYDIFFYAAEEPQTVYKYGEVYGNIHDKEHNNW